jgi:hypothetical protein
MNFLDLMDKLSEKQRENAVLVATAAANAGVDPTLAVAIAYQESRLNLNPARGSSGEIGMMQVMPSTGKGLGFSEKDLADPKKNIEAAIKYLKLGLAATGNDPMLAAAFYNGGPGAVEALKGGKDPDQRVVDYVRSLNSYGTFAQAPQGQPAGESDQQSLDQSGEQSGEQNLVRVPPPSTEVDSSGADEGSRFFLGGAGAALGTAASGLGAVMDKREERLIRQTALQERAKLNEQKVAREQERIAREARFAAAETAAKAAAAKGAATGPLSLMPTLDQQTRIQQGTTGDLGTTGRARSTGFNTETSQLSDSQKQAYARIEALKRAGLVAQNAPDLFANQPGMTSSPSGVLIPRSDPAQTLGPRPSPPLSFPRADPTGPRGTVFSRPPTPIPDLFTVSPDYVPPAPPPTTGQKIKSGLDLVTDRFNRMMRPVAGAVATGARYVLPPVAGLSAGLDIAEASHEYSKPEDQRDYKTIGLRGASALGGALSMIPIPATMALGTGLSLGASGLQAYREDPEIFKKMRRRIFSSDNPEQMVAP